jgi:hypothetical protein
MAGTDIGTIAVLESIVGKTPPAINLKVIDHLDEGARRWLAVSPLMFAGFGEGASIAVTLGGGAPGFAMGETATLRLSLTALDNPSLVEPGLGFGSLFLLPGIGETLRVNGRVTEIRDGEARIAVEECYVHCAKAMIRSAFWSAMPVDEVFDDPVAFISQSRFMALATIDPRRGADLSPKGDPAGSMARFADGKLWFADRPGNRRTDSFRNIIAQPRIAAALLVPGSNQVAFLKGTARLTADETARAGFAMQGKTPRLTTCIEDIAPELSVSGALERARLWPMTARVEGIDPAKMFVSHVKLNKDKGLSAKLAGAVMSVPGLMQKGLERDYKTNLY